MIPAHIALDCYVGSRMREVARSPATPGRCHIPNSGFKSLPWERAVLPRHRRSHGLNDCRGTRRSPPLCTRAAADGIRRPRSVGAFERYDTRPRHDHENGERACPPGADRIRMALSAPSLRRGRVARAPAWSPASVIAHAWAAQQRLHRRYPRNAARGKRKQHIVTAVAHELTGFVWAA